MTTQAVPANFRPRSGLSALLDHLYHVKFSKHVPLVMVLLFGIFAIYRTNHYVESQMHMGPIISWPLAVCIELAMLAAGAACFIAMRESYIRELKEEDADRARLGVGAAWAMFGTTTIALLVLAGADGSAESGGSIPFTLLMLLVQFVQSCAILVFLNIADLEERERLRATLATAQLEARQDSANRCPHCAREITHNNYNRHGASCRMRPRG